MPNKLTLVRALAVITLFFALPSSAAAQLRAEVVASGFDQPVAVVPDPLAPNTLFVVQQGGLILAVVDGVPQATPFLDLTEVVTFDNEQGLLGLVFRPDNPNVAFVSFINKRDPNLPFPTFEHGDTVVARFVRSDDDPLMLDPLSRHDLVWPLPFPGLPDFPFIYQPRAAHKGGTLAFGPDGYLYVGLGDGGGGNTPDLNAQTPHALLGKMVRIDVNVPDAHPKGYVIPPDNPFVDGQPIPALGEIWAFGYRNPWKFSFDDYGPGATGAMIVGDVGEMHREEINYEPAGRGGRNYGWFIREGAIPTPGVDPATPAAYAPLTSPLVDYPQTFGRAVTGGYVYRGSALSPLYRGRYFGADFFGRVFSLGLTIDGAGEAHIADHLDHTAELGRPRFIPTFGRGLDGELYFVSFTGGTIYKIVADTPELPGAPVGFSHSVAGSTVSLSWGPNANGGPTIGYQLEAGSQAGLADLATLQMLTPNLVIGGVPDGLYHLRVLALNSSGESVPTGDIEVRVGCVPPPAPTGLTANVAAGGLVTLTWNAVAGASGYLIDVGTASSVTEMVIPVGGSPVSGTVAPGAYFARVRANSACGASGASNEVLVQVP